jgi:hypothetical protein
VGHRRPRHHPALRLGREREIAAGLLVPVLPTYYQQADVWAVYPSRLSASAR